MFTQLEKSILQNVRLGPLFTFIIVKMIHIATSVVARTWKRPKIYQFVKIYTDFTNVIFEEIERHAVIRSR